MRVENQILTFMIASYKHKLYVLSEMDIGKEDKVD